MHEATRAEVVEGFVPSSPLVRHLGLRLTELGDDRAELAMPYREELATLGDVVHGGAVSALIDTAGMVAAWADRHTPAGATGGSTVGLSVDFVSAARGEDLVARATVIRRGRSLCFCEVDVTGEADQVVAKGLVTHRFA
jgi:uncharacterized protein (TIGR00369 family)